MAAYAATVTSLMRRAVKVDQVQGIGMYAGRVNLTNYNSTLVALAGISGKFKSLIAVIGSTAEGADVVEWVHASNSFKAYVASTSTEVADDVDVGEFDFVAFGII